MDENLKLLVAQIAIVIGLFMAGVLYAENINVVFYGTGHVIVRIVSLVLLCPISGVIWVVVDYTRMIDAIPALVLVVTGGTLWTIYACRTGLIFEV